MAASKNKIRPTSPPGEPFIEYLINRLHPYQREVAGGILLFFAILTLLSLLSLTGGSMSEWWAGLFTQLFGWGAIPAAAMLALFAVLLTFGRLKEEYRALPMDTIIGLELLLVVSLSLTHMLVFSRDQALKMALEGAGGGFIGWGVSSFLMDLIGLPATFLVLLGIGLAALGLTFRLMAGLGGEWPGLARDRAKAGSAVENEAVRTEDRLAAAQGQKKKKGPIPTQAPPKAPPAPTVMAADVIPAVLPRGRYPLPPLDLLSPPAKDSGQHADARYQAQIIEETLQGFGVPAEVVEINRGPTVTQFGLKLGMLERKLADGTVAQQRVRVSKVVALANDLALALSAAPIRIEAPVPGRPLVGIEVPNSEKTMVSLRSVVEDESFKKGRGALRVALGKGVAGQVASAALAEMPHLLIAGATGSGKSVCINAIISTLLFTHTPEQLRFLMIDPKMVELTAFNGIPHLLAPVVTDFEQVVGALAWVTREMERRYKLFASAGARSITSYNHKIGTKGDQLPYLVVVIDELADLMMMAPDEVERHVCRIAQMARATGIHLVIATQRPSVDVVTGLIKANFPTRIAFAVTSQIDSRVILDSPGAERLLGRGDMLYMAPELPKLLRLQGCFVSDAEIRNVVNYWQTIITRRPAPGPAESREPDQAGPAKLPWADLMAESDKDELLEEAVKVVLESERASTSLLQRRLGIGYPRASRLMDQLEAEGVIGPADGSKPREVLWRDNGDEGDGAEVESTAGPAASSKK